MFPLSSTSRRLSYSNPFNMRNNSVEIDSSNPVQYPSLTELSNLQSESLSVDSPPPSLIAGLSPPASPLWPLLIPVTPPIHHEWKRAGALKLKSVKVIQSHRFIQRLF